MNYLPFKISQDPQSPNVDRLLYQNTVVYKKREPVQYARVIFDLEYSVAGVPQKDRAGAAREFVVSNAHYVDQETGFRVKFDGVSAGVPFNVVNETNVPIANTAPQYDYFVGVIASGAYTEDQLVAKYVPLLDAQKFFD